ncbi:hypothetical protein V1281_006650 [Nitrobacteraceae bacterium AZCC 2161]
MSEVHIQDRRAQGKSAKGDGEFERFEEHGFYWIVRHTKTRVFHVSWYDPDVRQTRRRSLKTESSAEATKMVEQLVRDGVQGDPKEALLEKPMTYVTEALAYYKAERVPGMRSGPAAETAIKNFLDPRLGRFRINALRKRDVLSVSEQLQKEGYSLGYVSRILSTLRSSLNVAEEDGKIARAPAIPEIRGEEEIEAEELRGRVLSIPEVAIYFDAINERHFLDYSIHLLNTGGARPEAVLEATTFGIDWDHDLFELNPLGRVQTKKRRPIIRIAGTWKPWLRSISDGPIVSYDGQAVKSVKTAMRATVKRSRLPGRVNSTSIRHSIGRWLEDTKVPGREISLLLGHIPVTKKKSTRRYSPADPYHPDYLVNATRAIEEFVRAVNALTRKWDLERPGVVKSGWRKR